MLRQLINPTSTFFLAFLLFSLANAKNSEYQTFTVPSPQNEKSSQEQPTLKPAVTPDLEATGLDQTYVAPPPTQNSEYHLPPSESVTLAFSPVDDFSDKKSSSWFGVHVSPWMNATSRLQAGLDVHDRTGLLQGAYHFLHSRTRSRVYYGGGVTMRIDSQEKLSTVIKVEHYYVFAVAGWDYQIARQHSLRLEASFHQATEDHFVKGLAGYTYHF